MMYLCPRVDQEEDKLYKVKQYVGRKGKVGWGRVMGRMEHTGEDLKQTLDEGQ